MGGRAFDDLKTTQGSCRSRVKIHEKNQSEGIKGVGDLTSPQMLKRREQNQKKNKG